MARALRVSALLVFLALAVAALPAAATPAAPEAPPGRDVAAERHQRIVDYWTPARRASAVPREMLRPPHARAKGGNKPGGGSSSGTVTGATWSKGGSVVWTTGKVYFTLKGTRYVCSGSAVQGGNVVSTAGHCLHDGGGGPFATNWMFAPGHPSRDLGEWTATQLYTTTNWATRPNHYADDAGFAVVRNTAGSSLATALGSKSATAPAVGFGATPTGAHSAFGYPAAGRYKGNTLTYCSGPVTAGAGQDTGAMWLACDMTGGSSGGPWLQGTDANGNGGTQRSVNSYGYSGLARMYGPIFDAPEQGAYNGAVGGSCSTSTAFRCTVLP